MNSILVLLTISAVSLVCLVKETDGLKCYDCSDCYDPFDPTGISKVTCRGFCVKAKSPGFIGRACSDLDIYTDDVCAKVTQGGVDIESCVCSSDLCNGGSVQRLSIMLSLMIFVVMVLKKIYC
ncbi:hypothetical protein ACF0H5_009941 [Mactra antiquata]